MKLIKKTIMTLLVLILIIGGVTSMTSIKAKESSNELNKGLILFGPKGRVEGYDRFYHVLKDKLIQDFAFFPFGWGDIEIEEGVYDWSEFDELIEECKEEDRKFATAFWAAAHSFENAPMYLYTKYNIRRINSHGAFVNFENKSKYRGFSVLANGTLVNENDKVISQSTSLVGENGKFLSSEGIYLNSNYNNSLGFDYKVIKEGLFKVLLEKTDGEVKTLWEKEVSLDADIGENESVMIQIKKEDLEDYKRIVWVADKGQIVVDNVDISPEIPGEQGIPVAYPNYFDPLFKEKYKNFVEAFYERYKDEKTIATVYVGGFGRWDGGDMLDSGMSDIEDGRMLTEQWLSYGYTDDKYIDHIRWCGKLFEDTFKNTDKDIVLQSTAFSVPGDTSYVSWEMINLVTELGMGIKISGLTEKLTEWDVDANQYNWIATRFKHDNNKKFYLEEGIQVNNSLSEIMGHPLNVVNRMIIDNTDYYWFYKLDIYDAYVRKYLHYANEQAGSALVNKMYSIMGKFPYFSSHTNKTYDHYNLWTGLFTKNSTKLEFGNMNGVTYAKTTDKTNAIKISVDDRYKWAGMFGNTLTVDYYDSGTDKFYVDVMVPKGNSVIGDKKRLGTVNKTNTNTWKSVSYYDSEFANDKRSGGRDMPIEILIDDAQDGTEKISKVELNYVPVYEYKKKALIEKEIDESKKIMLSDEPISFEVEAIEGKSLCEIAVYVGEAKGKWVNVSSKVYVTTSDGKETILTEKDLYKPGSFCNLPMPLSNAPSDAVKYRVELKTTRGDAFVYANSENNIAYKVSEFVYDDPKTLEVANLNNDFVTLEALKDFHGLNIKGNGEVTLSISKKLPDGSFVENMFTKTINVKEDYNWWFEPQTAGIYRVDKVGSDKEFEISPKPLIRQEPPKESQRYKMGTIANSDFEGMSFENMWEPISNLKEVTNENGVFKALLDGENPVIETKKQLNIKTTNMQIFHLIMKNETSSPLTKVYWKTDKEDYSEKNSTLIPTVANDSEFREYSWPIGQEKTWKGTITQIKLVPVFGHTSQGRISIHTAEIMDNNKVDYELHESLDITKDKEDNNIEGSEDSREENKEDGLVTNNENEENEENENEKNDETKATDKTNPALLVAIATITIAVASLIILWIKRKKA